MASSHAMDNKAMTQQYIGECTNFSEKVMQLTHKLLAQSGIGRFSKGQPIVAASIVVGTFHGRSSLPRQGLSPYKSMLKWFETRTPTEHDICHKLVMQLRYQSLRYSCLAYDTWSSETDRQAKQTAFGLSTSPYAGLSNVHHMCSFHTKSEQL